MNEEFYTVREISQIYKISTSTLYKNWNAEKSLLTK